MHPSQGQGDVQGHRWDAELGPAYTHQKVHLVELWTLKHQRQWEQTGFHWHQVQSFAPYCSR